MLGEILNDTWLVKRRIGKGTSSELLVSRSVALDTLGSQVAVKLQNEGTDMPVVKYESDMLRSLGDLSTVPRYIHHGQFKGREYLVMELLGGEDMSHLRDRVRATR